MNRVDLLASLEADREVINLEPDEQTRRDALVRFLCELRDLQADLRGFFSDVQRDLFAIAGKRKWVVDEIGEVQVRKQTKRSEWDSEALTRVLVARALDERILDEHTGEYEPGFEAVARVLSECARPSWRVTPLRERGIDETEFCHVEEDGWGLTLPPTRTDVSTS